jgi:hypothetical protein
LQKWFKVNLIEEYEGFLLSPLLRKVLLGVSLLLILFMLAVAICSGIKIYDSDKIRAEIWLEESLKIGGMLRLLFAFSAWLDKQLTIENKYRQIID